VIATATEVDANGVIRPGLNGHNQGTGHWVLRSAPTGTPPAPAGPTGAPAVPGQQQEYGPDLVTAITQHAPEHARRQVSRDPGTPPVAHKWAVPEPALSIKDVLSPDRPVADRPVADRPAEPAPGVVPASIDDVLNPRPHPLLEFLEQAYGDTEQVRAFAADAAFRFADAMAEGPKHPHITPPPPDDELRTMLYHGWMYAAEAIPADAAESLQPGQAVSMPGFVRGSASEAAIPAGAAVVLAIYGTALDLSALRGQPPGTDLLIMPGTPYTVTGVAAHTDTTPTRLTLTE